MQTIFYQLKHYIKYYFPELNQHLLKDLKLDPSVIFISWFLTLCTLTTQFGDDRYYLDQVIDVFLAEQWEGFIKVVLVIVDNMKSQLQDLTQEKCLLKFSDVLKNNFAVLYERPSPPNLKKSYRYYSEVNEVNQKKLAEEF